MPRNLLQSLILTVGIASVIYAGACLALWRYQTRLMFLPSNTLEATPTTVGLTYEDVWLPAGSGQVHGWWIPVAGDGPVMLYLHGNGSNLGDLVNRARQFHQWGYSLLLIDYRGYGRSSGPFPNEARVYADAEAAWHHLTKQRQISADRIVLYGRSIGGAIAVHLAHHHPDAAGLILESPFTAMADMVMRSSLSQLFPVTRLLTQRFDNLEKVRSLAMPLLVMHGTVDATVPPEMGQALYDAAPEPKTLFLVDGADHNNLPQVAGDRYGSAVKTFIQGLE